MSFACNMLICMGGNDTILTNGKSTYKSYIKLIAKKQNRILEVIVIQKKQVTLNKVYFSMGDNILKCV